MAATGGGLLDGQSKSNNVTEGGLQCYLILLHLGQGPSSSKISHHI